MLELCIILLVVGILAIFLEIIMPGFDSFVSGIIGILALVASAVLAVVFLDAWFFVFVNSLILAFLLTFLIVFIKRKQFHGKIILNENLSEDEEAIDLSALVGREGVAVTALRPYGEADFGGGVRVEVCAPEAIVARGAKVRVVETLANKVVVAEVLMERGKIIVD